jgi:hypothetical protein
MAHDTCDDTFYNSHEAPPRPTPRLVLLLTRQQGEMLVKCLEPGGEGNTGPDRGCRWGSRLVSNARPRIGITSSPLLFSRS